MDNRLPSEKVTQSVSNVITDKEAPRNIADWLGLIEWANHEACIHLYWDHQWKMDQARGSTTKHQAWEGGYLDHLWETMDLAERLYSMQASRWRSLPFSLGDAVLVLFLHDLEKPWKYAWNESERQKIKEYKDVKDFIFEMAEQYGIQLSDDHVNALKYIHGEGDDYDPKIRVQWPLAAFVHICDTWSARIDYNYPIQDIYQ